MTASWRSWKLSTVSCLVIGSAIALLGDFAVAQITSDLTLGNESSTVTSTSTVDQIDGGATRGANLFHSFQEFNIGEGRAAYFTNPAGIENILSRVTGGNASEIQGELGVLGNASLFLINPHGIIFGANASLDIRGSFVASTASSIKFADGKQFSATAPQTTPLLTVSVPFGLQLETNNSGAIANTGNLAVGQNLTLAAGKLDIQSGQLQAGESLALQASDTVRLTDSVEHPLIIKAGDRLVIQGDQAIDIFALNHPASGFFSGKDTVLRSANTVAGDAYYTTGGNFRVEQLDGSLGSLSSPRDPIIQARGDVTFNSYTGASLHILAGGSVNIPDNVTITSTDTSTNSIVENVTLSDGTTVVAINGNTQPTLDIRAGTNTFGNAESLDGTATSADIAIGSINNTGGTVFLTNQYNPNTLLSGGVIQVGAIDTSAISGNAGSVTIDSRDFINLNNNLNATGASNGDGGIINLKAQNDITTNNIFTYVGFGGVGNGGNISLSSRQGAINTTAGRLDTGATFGNGGAIKLQSQGDITTAEIRSNKVARDAGVGNGGDISLTSTQGGINTTAGTLYSFSDNGNSGAVDLKAQNDIITKDIITYVGYRGVGNSGNIFLTSTQGAINTTAGKLDAGTTFGNGGSIALQARNSIATGDLISFVVADGRGDGGDISLTSMQGAINTTAGTLYSLSENGNGGAIILNAAERITIGNAQSLSRINGDGGDIYLTSTQGAIDTKASTINSTANNGNAGVVTLDSGGSITTGEIASNSQSNGGTVTLKAQGDIITTGNILTLALKPDKNSNNTEDVGNSGNIFLSSTAGAIDTTKSSLDAGTTFRNGGAITLSAYKDITTGNLNSYVVGRGRGNGGDISLTSTQGAIDTKAGNLSATSNDNAGAVTLNSGGSITTGEIASNSQSNGGTVTLKAQGDIITTGNILTLALKPEKDSSDAGNVGNSGNIFLSSTAGAINTASSSLDAGTTFRNGGAIALSAYKDITTGDLNSYVIGSGRGNGGDIYLTSTQGAIDTRLGLINSYSDSDGTAGNITLNAAGNITAGDIQSGPVSTEAGGAGGDINLTSNADIYISNSRISAITRGSRKGGNINITARSLFATKGAELITNTFGEGTAGNVTINARDRVSLDGGQEVITLESQGAIPGGSRFLRRTNGRVDLAANPSTDTRWSIDEVSDGVVTLKSQSSTPGSRFLDGRTVEGEVGLAPNTTKPFTGTRWRVNKISDGIITLKSQSSTPGSRFLDGRTVEGEVGLVPNTNEPFTGTRWRVNEDRQGFISTKIYSRVENGAEGQGGQIHITTGSLFVTNGALLSTSTDGKINANAGSVTIDARNSVSLDGVGRDGVSSSVNSNVLQDAGGQAGGVIINVPAGLLSVTNDARLSARTFLRSTGKGGDVRITAGHLSVRDGSEVTVNSRGSGDAGSLTVNANSIELDSSGKITGTTASGRGGNIRLDVQELIVMRDNSAIATTANQNGSGGNITINSPLIVAAPNENSDILANAFEGNGGNIDIRTQGIFGLEFREQLTLQSDINASSDFGLDGTVEINTPDIDPNSGLVNLPTVPVDTEIAQACTPGSSQSNSEFIVTGRGGLPPTPTEALSTDAIAVDWVTLQPESENKDNTASSTSPTTPESKPIVEAQGWIINHKGEVVLTASVPTATPRSSWQTLANCS